MTPKHPKTPLVAIEKFVNAYNSDPRSFRWTNPPTTSSPQRPLLPANPQRPRLQTHDVGGVFDDQIVPTRRRGEIKTIDLPDLEAESAAQQRLFLQAWQGRVPSDLAIIYLGLIGRNADLKQLANEWAADATNDVDTLWADLYRHFPIQILHPNPSPEEVDQRRFVLEQVAGQHVRSTAMSGDLFNAPLGGAANGVIVGNLHKTSQGIRAADGRKRSLITLPLRHDPHNASDGAWVPDHVWTIGKLIKAASTDWQQKKGHGRFEVIDGARK